jgi:hypothetical protein
MIVTGGSRLNSTFITFSPWRCFFQTFYANQSAISCFNNFFFIQSIRDFVPHPIKHLDWATWGGSLSVFSGSSCPWTGARMNAICHSIKVLNGSPFASADRGAGIGSGHGGRYRRHSTPAIVTI